MYDSHLLLSLILCHILGPKNVISNIGTKFKICIVTYQKKKTFLVVDKKIVALKKYSNDRKCSRFSF